MSEKQAPVSTKKSIFMIKQPFTREFPIEHRMRLPGSDEVIASICRTIEARMSASLIAPAGTGKTVILRAVTDKLPPARYDVRYIKVTDLSKRDMCQEIAAAVGAKPSGCYCKLVRNIQEHFTSTHSNNAKRPVLIIDEAHEMRRDTVRIIKLLTNFEMDSKLIVGLVIAGQPPLRRMLLQDELSDIAQRIYHHEELRLLSKDESYDYLRHRCDMAGLTVFPFDQKACVAIYEITRGNMRAMDNLALKSLEIAENKKIEAIDETIVTLARKKLWL